MGVDGRKAEIVPDAHDDAERDAGGEHERPQQQEFLVQSVHRRLVPKIVRGCD
jgi:hypothetical protein